MTHEISTRLTYRGPKTVGHRFGFRGHVYEIVKVAATYVVATSDGHRFTFETED